MRRDEGCWKWDEKDNKEKMGNVISNLKAKFGVDTSDFKKGLKDGEKAMGDFKGAAGDQIAEFASMFGVNMSGVNNAVVIASKSLDFLKQSVVAARNGGDALAITWKALKWLFASSGIGVLIIALASLGTYFTKTTAGAKELSIGLARIKAAGTVLLERFGEYGGGLWDMLKGDFAGGYKKMSEAMYGLASATNEAANRAAELAAANYTLINTEREFNVRKSEQTAILEELRLKSRDIELSAKERLKALNGAAAIEQKTDKEALSIAAEKIINAQAALQIDTQSKEKKDELADAYVRYNGLISESFAFERSLARQKGTLTKEIIAQTKATKDANDEIQRQFGSFSNLKMPDILAPYRKSMEALDKTADKLQHTYIKVGEAQSALFQVMGTVGVDVSDSLNAGFEAMAVGLGEFFGQLAAGQGGAGGFAKAIISVFADLAINVGKVIIAAAIAKMAIDQALITFGGAGFALAAGIALVAVGTALKSSLSAAASGGGGSASGSGSGTGSTIYDSRTGTEKAQNIELSGKFTVEGSALVLVLNQENIRRKIINGR